MKYTLSLIKSISSTAKYCLYRIKQGGTTANRPVLTTADAGFQYYDTTIGKPVWWDGSTWKDATGTSA